jgi:hypothetical protein
VPAGWWHAVLNVGFSIAITENFMAAESLPHTWDALRQDHPDFAQALIDVLQLHRPELFAHLTGSDAQSG